MNLQQKTLSIFVFKGSESSWFSFLLPMSTEVWISLLVATIIVIVTMAFITKMSNGPENYSSLIQILSSLLGQGSGEIPRFIFLEKHNSTAILQMPFL